MYAPFRAIHLLVLAQTLHCRIHFVLKKLGTVCHSLKKMLTLPFCYGNQIYYHYFFLQAEMNKLIKLSILYLRLESGGLHTRLLSYKVRYNLQILQLIFTYSTSWLLYATDPMLLRLCLVCDSTYNSDGSTVGWGRMSVKAWKLLTFCQVIWAEKSSL